MNKNLIIALVVAVVVGGASFYGGMQYQKSQTAAMGPGGGQFAAGTGQRPSGMSSGVADGSGTGMRPISGEILSFDGQTLTIKADDGNKIVIYSPSTTINTTTDGSADDLADGASVMVIGTEADDGTVNAQTISVGGGFGGGMIGQPPAAE